MNKMIRKILFLVLVVLVVAPSVWAAGGGHHIPEWGDIMVPLILRIINFSAFAVLLFFLARKPVMQFLADRRKQVEESVKGSAERKAWAEQMFSDYNRRLEEIGTEIERIKTSLKEEGEEEKQEIIANAKKLAASIEKDAHMVADAEWVELKRQLRDDAVETAAMVAKETILRQINADDHKRVAGDFINELKAQ